jgi:hypothetical protein
MKKIILSAFIAFSIVSCSNDNDAAADTTATNHNGSVEVSFGNSFLQPSRTGKPVDRGSIPVAIDQITVDATNITTPTFPQSTTVFDLVTGGTQTKFFLDGLASGTNSFTAKATTNGPKVSDEAIYDDATNGALNAFNANKGVTPYAKYTATTSATIDFKAPKTIAFNMATSNGKLNTYVYTGPTITATSRKVIVTRATYTMIGGTPDPANDTVIDPAQIFNITGSKSFVSTWSNDLAIVGNYAVLVIDVYDQAGAQIETTSSTIIKIKASTTINTTIAITKDGITTSENEALFNFPDWIVEGN